MALGEVKYNTTLLLLMGFQMEYKIYLKFPNLLGNVTEIMLDCILKEKAPIIGKNNQSSSSTSKSLAFTSMPLVSR